MVVMDSQDLGSIAKKIELSDLSTDLSIQGFYRNKEHQLDVSIGLAQIEGSSDYVTADFLIKSGQSYFSSLFNLVELKKGGTYFFTTSNGKPGSPNIGLRCVIGQNPN